MSYSITYWNSPKRVIVDQMYRRNAQGRFSSKEIQKPKQVLSDRAWWEFSAVMLLVVMWLLGFVLHQTAHAAEPSPTASLMTNKAVCEYLTMHGMQVRGATIAELTNLCAKEGINL